MNFMAAIFDLIILDVARQNATHFFNLYRILMQNQVEIHF